MKMTKLLPVVAIMMLCGCSNDDETGACVSSPSDITGRTYCYSNYTSDECSDRNNQQVNGADWYFHGGQTCADRGLSEGSN